MTDREKVQKGLEYHLKELSVGKTCFECPYWGDNPCEIQLIADALELLKEQKAVPVMQRELMHMLFWCCGSCCVPVTDGDKYCRMCGKELKWDEQKPEADEDK